MTITSESLQGKILLTILNLRIPVVTSLLNKRYLPCWFLHMAITSGSLHGKSSTHNTELQSSSTRTCLLQCYLNIKWKIWVNYVLNLMLEHCMASVLDSFTIHELLSSSEFPQNENKYPYYSLNLINNLRCSWEVKLATQSSPLIAKYNLISSLIHSDKIVARWNSHSDSTCVYFQIKRIQQGYKTFFAH